MDLQAIFENITNPSLLYFFLGIFAVCIKSDLEIPPTSAKFISLYLLFAIGFRGGQELSHEHLDQEVFYLILLALGLSAGIPIYTFFLLRRKMSVFNATAIAASYGSVSAVTFVTAVSYLEQHGHQIHGYMVAIMALMEAPAIMIAFILLGLFKTNQVGKIKLGSILGHAFSNGSVLLILGSLVIGFVADTKQAQGIAPFTNDLFKGFLAIFLLDMGITSGHKLKSLFAYGWFPFAFATIIPLVNGALTAYLSGFVTDEYSNRFMMAILAASASYIAVPAAMKINVPEADPGLYVPMALGISFPINITLGMSLYNAIAQVPTM